MDFTLRRGTDKPTPPDRGISIEPSTEAETALVKVEPRQVWMPYLPGLDGLRAISVLAVLLYHAGAAFVPGGFLGVEVFFVISGYLITLLLLSEWCVDGEINLKKFWLRRARRLLPAVFALLIFALVFSVIFLPNEVASLRHDILAAFGYVTNWYQIATEQSYFEASGRPSLLQHLWSLAVEEQFYIIFPIIFSFTVKRWYYKVVPYFIIAALSSTVLMSVLYDPAKDPSRVYYGTDTRAAGLLVGVALAFLWLPWLNNKKLAHFYEFLLNLSGFVALAALIWYFTNLTEFNPFLYRGGFLLVAVTTAILIAITVHPQATIFAAVLSFKPLVWLGLRSYSIYLWHWVVFVLTRPQVDVRLDGFPLLVLRFGLTLGLAEISYRFIETPFRKGVLERWWWQWRNSQGKQRRLLTLRWTSVLGTILVSGLIFSTAAATAKPSTPSTYYNEEVFIALFSTPTVAVPTVTPTLKIEPTVAATLVVTPQPVFTPAPVASPTPTPVPANFILAIGDSVLKVATKDLEKMFGNNIVVDTSIGRHFPTLPGIIDFYRQKGLIGNTVLIHLGSNGGFDDKHFDQVMTKLKDVKKVVFVNLKVPRQWESYNNSVLAKGVKRYPNVVLVDWYGASINHPEYFASDGFHPRGVGAQVYLDLLTKALK
jgi:peptidoglycan/LPS O-acetylase OafA/YrhL